jgi:TolB-like protein/class 3 adenylate cyclase/Flp pilus assembly protein TadD
MATEPSSVSELELGHVLFMDIVGYSKLLVDEQSDVTRQLNRIVRDTEQVRTADAKGKLVRLPTGDGMALVFFTSPEAPIRCALEISRALKENPAIKLRMGLHSGPVDAVPDVNERQNVAGGGINLAQRVMDCGDAGHILLSKHLAEDLAQYARWRDHLHELGQIEVKHGLKLDVANFYNHEVGNAELPEKFMQAAKADRVLAVRRRKRIVGVAAVVVAVFLGAGFWIFVHRASLPIAALPVSEKSIAVLPFQNLSDEKENAYFTDGVQDEILSDLAKIADLKVISRTSVMLYKAGSPRNLREIGQQLGVAHVVEGSVQRAGGKIRVIAQLIDAQTDKHLWAQTYDRELNDVFAIETEVAQAIANELQAKLSPAEKVSIEEKPTRDLVAYDLYVRALPLIDWAVEKSNGEKDLATAVDLLNQAIARDPSFALAYCRLALAHDDIYFLGFDHTAGRLEMAKSAIDSAFRLKPDSGESHLALAGHYYWGYLDYDRARDELALAQRTLPNNSRLFFITGLIDRRQGRWADAVRNLERASELDPQNDFTLGALQTTYSLLRDYKKELTILDRRQTLHPNDPHLELARAIFERQWHADLRPWHAEIEKRIAENPASADDWTEDRVYLALLERDFDAAASFVAKLPQNTLAEKQNRNWWMGYVARLRGDSAAAQADLTAARLIQEELIRAEPNNARLHSDLGWVNACLGRKEEALREGRRSLELLPLTKNPFDGADMLEEFAEICVLAGENDLALQQLETLAKIPSNLDYGRLRLETVWDPLRGDPRFERIVQSLAPKDGK